MTGSQREEGREGLTRNFIEREIRTRGGKKENNPHVFMSSERMLR